MRAEKYEQFISDGIEDEQVRIGACEKIVWAIKSKFFDTLISGRNRASERGWNATWHLKLSDIEDKKKRGIYAFKLVKRVLSKHKHKFESLFQYKRDADEDSESVEDSPDEPTMKCMRPLSQWRERDDCKMISEYSIISTGNK